MQSLLQRIESAAAKCPELVYIPRACRPTSYKEIAAEFAKLGERRAQEADARFRKYSGAAERLLDDTAMGIAFDSARGRRHEDLVPMHHRLAAAYTDWTRIALRQAWIWAFRSHHMNLQAIERGDSSLVRAVEQNIQTLVRTVGVLLTNFDETLIAVSRGFIHATNDVQAQREALSKLLSTDRQLWQHTQIEFLHRHCKGVRQNGHRSPIRHAHATHVVCSHGRSRAFTGQSMQMAHTTASSCCAMTLNLRPKTVATTSIVSPVGKSIKTRFEGPFLLDTVAEEEGGEDTADLRE
jgi:hypothetical protein